VPVDPHIAAVLDMLATMEAPPLHQGSPDDGRQAYLGMTAGMRAPEHVVPVRETREITVAGAEGELRARVYRPEGDGPFPVVAFFHGGGFVIGDLETHDNMARNICRGCSAVVVAVDYRLAPEAPFPAAAHDVVAATRWIAEHAAELEGDGRLAVAGDSAGGNLSAVVAPQLRDSGGPALVGQFLIYPSVDAGGDYPSRAENGKGYMLETETMEWFFNHYSADPANNSDPRLSPLQHSSLAGLPPAVVVTAEYDPLRDEGEVYADALRAAGVPVEVRRYDGMIHGFFDMGNISPGAQAAIDDGCALFAAVLRG
jgi:acetyl esterase